MPVRVRPRAPALPVPDNTGRKPAGDAVIDVRIETLDPIHAARIRHVVAALSVCIAATLPAADAAAQPYLRVGLGAGIASDTRFLDVDCASAMPAALYGCGESGDGAPLSTVGEFGTTAGLELGAGYAVGPAVRVELLIEYRPDVPFEGQANFLAPDREQSVTVERSSLSGMVGVVFDLASIGGPTPAGLRPFAGVGIGRVRHRLGEMRMRFPRTETIVPGAASTQWAWTVTAGFSRGLLERTVLDVAWRYANQGDAVTGEGGGRVEWRDGSRTLPLDLAPTHAQVNHHSVGLSVRYEW